MEHCTESYLLLIRAGEFEKARKLREGTEEVESELNLLSRMER
jgi:hypothetical protein